ncbi:MAG: DUF1700 domain-containing protein [Lachnospiraceae bacterium]|jgi:hypothetical protein
MNRQEFMAQLSRLLSDIDEQERQEALDYYESYFDDAGEDNEATVIQELGNPGKVAAMIKADLECDGKQHGEYTDTGYEDARFRESKDMPEPAQKSQKSRQEGWTDARDGETGHSYSGYESQTADRGRYQKTRKRGAGGWALIIIAIVFTSPLWFGLLGGGLGLLLGFIGLLIGLIVTVIGVGVGGIALVCKGIVGMTLNPATGLLQFGGGLLLTAFGLLGIMLMVLCLVKGLPALTRGCVNLAQRIFYHGRSGDSA